MLKEKKKGGSHQFCSHCREEYEVTVQAGFIFRPRLGQRSANEAHATCAPGRLEKQLGDERRLGKNTNTEKGRASGFMPLP